MFAVWVLRRLSNSDWQLEEHLKEKDALMNYQSKSFKRIYSGLDGQWELKRREKCKLTEQKANLVVRVKHT
jgi:hypothetical protein